MNAIHPPTDTPAYNAHDQRAQQGGLVDPTGLTGKDAQLDPATHNAHRVGAAAHELDNRPSRDPESAHTAHEASAGGQYTTADPSDTNLEPTSSFADRLAAKEKERKANVMYDPTTSREIALHSTVHPSSSSLPGEGAASAERRASATPPPGRAHAEGETTTTKVSVADKVVGTAEVLMGRATHNVNKEYVGEVRKQEGKEAARGLYASKNADTAALHNSSLAK